MRVRWSIMSARHEPISASCGVALPPTTALLAPDSVDYVVAIGGILSGLWLGVFIGLVFALFTDSGVLQVLTGTVFLVATFGLVWALIGYAFTRGRRDFSSVTQVIATRHEVLVEHSSAARARELLAKPPGALPHPFS